KKSGVARYRCEARPVVLAVPDVERPVIESHVWHFEVEGLMDAQPCLEQDRDERGVTPSRARPPGAGRNDPTHLSRRVHLAWQLAGVAHRHPLRNAGFWSPSTAIRGAGDRILPAGR